MAFIGLPCPKNKTGIFWVFEKEPEILCKSFSVFIVIFLPQIRKLYILTLENVEFLNTIIENSYIEKRKIWNSEKKERYKHFLEEFQELWQYKLLSNSN